MSHPIDSHPECLPRTELESRQWVKLTTLLQAVRESRFWKNRLTSVDFDSINRAKLDSASPSQLKHRLTELLQSIPLTQKNDFVRDQAEHPPYGSNLTFPVASYSRLHQTSGTTTGQPMRWLDTPQSWDWFMDCWAQIWRIVEITPADILCFPFSFGPFIGFWAGFEGANRLGNLCLPGGGMTSQARLKLIAENEATVVCCTPTYGLRLAEVAAEQGLNLRDSSIRLVVVAGEPGGSIPAIREKLEQAWGARVIDHWGMTELGAIGVECIPNPGGLHLLETECIVEILDPATLESVEPNANGDRHGELVITNLGRIGSPVIRYRTGDLVTAEDSVCSCGRSLVRLKGGILGRVDDMVTIRGNNVFPSSVEAILRSFPEVVEFRIEVKTVRSMQHMRILIEPTDRESQSETLEGLLNRIGDAIQDRLNFTAEIELASEPLPRFELKGRRFHRMD